MVTADECWESANRCLRRADLAEMPRMREYWRQMADRWMQCADDVQALDQQRAAFRN